MRFEMDDNERLTMAKRLGLPATAADGDVAAAISEFFQSDEVAAEMAAAHRKGVLAQAVVANANVEDIRRAFYDNVALLGLPEWAWLRAVYVDPMEVIADDDEGTLYRIAYEINDDAVTFGQPAKVQIEYVTAASGGLTVKPLDEGRTVVVSFADKEASRPEPRQPSRSKRPAAPPVARRADCEQAIAAAIAGDKITPARADHYRHRWNRDPVGTARTMARMASVPGLNAMVAADAGDSGYPEDWLQRPAPRPDRDAPRGRSRIHYGGN
jgi:hypothetical protein